MTRAEALYEVRGDATRDPTEPPHAAPYPHPPVPHEPAIADLDRRLTSAGLHPAPLPLALDLDRWLARGRRRGMPFPTPPAASSMPKPPHLAQALDHPNVTLKTGARRPAGDEGRPDHRFETSAGRFTAPRIVLAAGAVHTAALLLRSANEDHPQGLANRSDQVGRNFMNHNASALLALSPRRNRCVYQKTLHLNDWYLTGGPTANRLATCNCLAASRARSLPRKAGCRGLWRG